MAHAPGAKSAAEIQVEFRAPYPMPKHRTMSQTIIRTHTHENEPAALHCCSPLGSPPPRFAYQSLDSATGPSVSTAAIFSLAVAIMGAVMIGSDATTKSDGSSCTLAGIATGMWKKNGSKHRTSGTPTD